MHLLDVGFDALFSKSDIAVCLILYVFNEQRAPLSLSAAAASNVQEPVEL